MSFDPGDAPVPTPFGRIARHGLSEAVAVATAFGDRRTDFRAAICRFEDDLFGAFPAGHRLMDYDSAAAMLREVFAACDRPPPRLALVDGFDDPKVGGYADVANHRIAIERGFLYRFLVLHEAAHLLVPEDRRHGPAFTFILQLLYRSFIDVPEHAVRHFLCRHGLPAFTGFPAIEDASGVGEMQGKGGWETEILGSLPVIYLEPGRVPPLSGGARSTGLQRRFARRK